MSFEFYQELKSHAKRLFDEEMKRHSTMEIDEEPQITQDRLINYWLAILYETGVLTAEDQKESMVKILKAVIKKMIKDDRMIMVQQDSLNEDQRVLSLHTNYRED